MNKRPEVGDTIIIRGTVTYVDDMFFRYIQENRLGDSILTPLERISELIPKPWEPKVGDTVWVKNYISMVPKGGELLWMNDEFSLIKRPEDGYPPMVFHTNFLRKDRASCVA